jgi:hypothetical protein
MVNKNLSLPFNIYIKNAMIGDLTAKTLWREGTRGIHHCRDSQSFWGWT